MALRCAVQSPNVQEKELAYLQETVQASYEQMEAARGRLLELLHHAQHRRRIKSAPRWRLRSCRNSNRKAIFPRPTMPLTTAC